MPSKGDSKANPVAGSSAPSRNSKDGSVAAAGERGGRWQELDGQAPGLRHAVRTACGEDGSKPLEGLKQESQDPVTV